MVLLELNNVLIILIYLFFDAHPESDVFLFFAVTFYFRVLKIMH